MALSAAALQVLGAVGQAGLGVASTAASTWLSSKIQQQMGASQYYGQEGANHSESYSQSQSYGEGSSESGSQSKSEGGTNDELIGQYLNRYYGYNDQTQANQKAYNTKSMIMQMGYNTMGAVAQGIYNAISQKAAMQYNSAEATANRNWQEHMSNTSYQRAVEDMRKAGINPILAYAQGGASTPSGGQGTVGGASMGLATSSALGSTALGGTVPNSYYSWSEASSYSKSAYWNASEGVSQMISSGYTTPKALYQAAEKAVEADKAAPKNKDVEGGPAAKKGNDKGGYTGNYNAAAKNDKSYEPGKNPYTGG